MTPEELNENQILTLLDEVLPPELKPTLIDGGGLDFVYSSPFGPVLTLFRREQGRAHLTMQIPEPGTPIPAPLAARPADARPGTGTAATPSGTAVSTSSTGGPAILSLFRRMVSEGCSDLHISTRNPPLFRKDGDIVTLGSSDPLSAEQCRDLLLAITPDGHKSRFEQLRDVDFSYDVPGLARFRCNLFVDRRGIGGVFRVIPNELRVFAALSRGKKPC